MNIKIRSLAVSGMCLMAFACTDASPAREAAKTETKFAPATSTLKPALAEPPALTTTAEAKPRTILDAPASKQEPALEPGSYRAVLRTLDGEEIASHPFTIE